MSGVIAAAGISAAAGLAGGMMQSGKGGSGMSQQMQQQSMPGGIQQREMDNYDLAMQTANQLMGPYTGQRVADMTPEMRNLIGQLYGNVGSTNAGFQQAIGQTNALSGFTSPTVNTQLLRDANLSPYMNPYTQQIIDPSIKLMNQARQQGLNQIGDTAAQTRAFGGSRQGIAEGVLNAQSALQQGQFGAQLYGQNFLNAQQQAAGDITRQYQSDV